MSTTGDDDGPLGAPPFGASKPSAELVGRSLGHVGLEQELIEGPGAWLYRARDASGRRALVQVTCLRRVESHEARAFNDLLRSVAAATAQLGQDPEVSVEDHGYEEPLRALYWILPWTGAAERIGQTRIDGSQGLVAAALSLLDRIEARHGRGRLDPLLHPSLVVPRTGGADLVGVPITIPADWLGPEMQIPPYAPEERTVGEARRSGDLWRLGETLRMLATEIESPVGFESFIDRLSDPDPSRRLASAQDALLELEALQGTVAGVDRSNLFPVGEHLRQVRAASETLLDSPDPLPPAKKPPSTEESTLSDVPVDALEGPQINPVVKSRPTGPDEAPTMWMKREEVSRARRAEAPQPTPVDQTLQGAPAPPNASDLSPLGPKGTVVGVRLPEDDRVGYGDGLGGVHLAPRTLGPPTRVFDDPASEPDRVPASENTEPAPPAETPPSDLQNPPVDFRSNRFGPSGTVASQLPPIGAPPVRSFRPPHPQGEAEGRRPQVQDETERRPLGSPPLGEVGVGLSPSEEPPRVAAAHRRTGRLALTLTLLILLAILAGTVVQLLKPPKPLPTESVVSATAATPDTEHRTVTPWNDVLLEAAPPTAKIVGERDGRTLGTSPVRLLVPANTEVAVLITAPGFEPVRLVLPTRGRVTVHLTSTGGVLDCPVEIQAPGSKPLEVVGLDLESDKGRYPVPGAVVMRSVEGHGAWLVRCATYGGQRRHRFVSRALKREIDVLVREPKGAQITIEGARLGPTPARRKVSAGFVQVEAALSDGAKVARWIPAFGQTSVSLPRPPPPPAPKPERPAKKRRMTPRQRSQ